MLNPIFFFGHYFLQLFDQGILTLFVKIRVVLLNNNRIAFDVVFVLADQMVQLLLIICDFVSTIRILPRPDYHFLSPGLVPASRRLYPG